MKKLTAILLTSIVSFSSFAATIDAPVGERWVAIADKPGVYRVDVYDYDKGEYVKGARYDYVTEQTVVKKYDPVTGNSAGTATITPDRNTKWNWEQSQSIDSNSQGVSSNTSSITNNSAGISSNASKLTSVQGQVNSNTNSINSVREDVKQLDSRVDGLEESMKKMGDDIIKMDDRLDQVTATTHAVVNARPMTHVAGDFAMGVGLGYAGGAEAIAIGVGYQISEAWSVSSTLNYVTSHGKASDDTSAGAGVQYVF